jgi:hypothetical protein
MTTAIIEKVTTFKLFINGLYIKLHKSPNDDVKKVLNSDPLEIIAMLKTSINLLGIQSHHVLFSIVKDKVGISDKDLSELTNEDITKLKRYSEYFYAISKML